MKLICGFCKKIFEGKKNRKFCSAFCFGDSRADYIIARNKARRKYPEMEGKTRQQIYWMHNEKSRNNHLERDRRKRLEVIDKLGGSCVKCGYCKDKRALVLDHILSDGAADRLRVGARIYRYYVNNIDEAKIKLQILCANCNLIKSFDNNEHNTSRRVIYINEKESNNDGSSARK